MEVGKVNGGNGRAEIRDSVLPLAPSLALAKVNKLTKRLLI